MTTKYNVGGIDLSNVLCPFVDISGGLGKISPTTNYQVGGIDLSNTYTSFVTYGSKGVIETGYDVSGSDLATIFQPIVTNSLFYTSDVSGENNNIYGLTSDTLGNIYFYNNYGTNQRIVQLNKSGQMTGWVCASNNDIHIDTGISSITYNSGFIYYSAGGLGTRVISRISTTSNTTDTSSTTVCNAGSVYSPAKLLNFDSHNNLYFAGGNNIIYSYNYIYEISGSIIDASNAFPYTITSSNIIYDASSGDISPPIQSMCIDLSNNLYVTTTKSTGLTITKFVYLAGLSNKPSTFFNYGGTTIGSVYSMICKNNILYILYKTNLAVIDTTKTIDGSYNLIYLTAYKAYDNSLMSVFDISNNLYLSVFQNSTDKITKFIW